MKKNAFTLVELLVVVAVIGILASLIMPAVSRAKHSGRSAVCQNNIRQAVIDMKASLVEDPGGQVWMNDGSGEFFNPTSTRSVLCPEASEVTKEEPEYEGTVDRAYKFNERRSSYGQNGHVLISTYLSKNADLESIAAEPSSTPQIMDCTSIMALPMPDSLPATDLYHGTRPDNWNCSMGTVNIPRHGNRPKVVSRNWPETSPLPGAINVGFFDGHVRVVRLDDLWGLKWSRDYEPPAKRPGLGNPKG